jgi:acyl-CoA hydrolase
MTELVLPQHTNALGGVFGGVVMSWIDVAAAICASRHSGKVCVTASIDELHFLKPIRLGFVVNIEAQVTAVHRTSCEVQVKVAAEGLDQERFHTATAYLTFVALDGSGQPTPMPELKLRTDEEKRLARAARLRKEARKRLKEQLAT